MTSQGDIEGLSLLLHLCQGHREKLGRMMRRLREDSDISLRQAAKLIGVSAPFLSDCELGRRQLSLVDLQEFVNACSN